MAVSSFNVSLFKICQLLENLFSSQMYKFKLQKYTDEIVDVKQIFDKS